MSLPSNDDAHKLERLQILIDSSGTNNTAALMMTTPSLTPATTTPNDNGTGIVTTSKKVWRPKLPSLYVEPDYGKDLLGGQEHHMLTNILD